MKLNLALSENANKIKQTILLMKPENELKLREILDANFDTYWIETTNTENSLKVHAEIVRGKEYGKTEFVVSNIKTLYRIDGLITVLDAETDSEKIINLINGETE